MVGLFGILKGDYCCYMLISVVSVDAIRLNSFTCLDPIHALVLILNYISFVFFRSITVLILCCNSRFILVVAVYLLFSFKLSIAPPTVSTLFVQVVSLMATAVEHLVTGETMQISTSREQRRRSNMFSLSWS